MENKECTGIKAKFSDYLDELLPESEMAELERHIKKCPACAAELEAFNKTVLAVRNLPRYTPHINIIVKINDRIQKNKNWWQKLNTKAFRGSVGAVFAIIIGVLGLQYYNGTGVAGIFKTKEEALLFKGGEFSKKTEADQKNLPAGKNKGSDKNPLSGKLQNSQETSSAFKKNNGRGNQQAEQKMRSSLAGLKEEDISGAPAPLRTEHLIIDKAFEQKSLYCANSIKENLVIKDEAAFKKLWGRCFDGLPEPVIDFEKEMLIAVFLGMQETEPKDVTIKEIIPGVNKLKINSVLTAIINAGTPEKKLSPYHLKAVKKSALEAEFTQE